MMQEPSPNTRLDLLLATDPIIAIILDTLQKERQAIVFVNTKRSAESQAEKIAAKLKTNAPLKELADQALKVLSSPTKQCKRLAKCLEKGVAFHHAGLPSKQRDLIEESFKKKIIKVICATPTLAAGVDLPAFRVIIRDLKRYGGPWGMTSIPVLEYEQMAGRAGRPGKDPWGEAVCIAKDEREAQHIIDTYIHGEPEEIFSKLAVEPVMRTYILSLVASEFVKTTDELRDFFSKTFYAHQYGDLSKLFSILESMLQKLEDWEFLIPRNEPDELFTSANEINKSESLKATRLGKRVSELYLDPYTAHHLLKGLKRKKIKQKSVFGILHLCASCLELRPYIKCRQADAPLVDEKLTVEESGLLHLPPSTYTDEYDTFLDTIKTTMLFEEWISEADEESLLDVFGVRPGELHGKLEVLDWIVYAASEIAKITSFHEERGELLKLRIRLKHGAKEELLPLLKLREVGRVRARKLVKAGVKDVSSLKRYDPQLLADLVGKATAIKLKEQVGEKIAPEHIQVKAGKRKGQKSIIDWGR